MKQPWVYMCSPSRSPLPLSPLLTVPSLFFLIRPSQEARENASNDSNQSPFQGASGGTFRGSALLRIVIGQVFASAIHKHRV